MVNLNKLKCKEHYGCPLMHLNNSCRPDNKGCLLTLSNQLGVTVQNGSIPRGNSPSARNESKKWCSI